MLFYVGTYSTRGSQGIYTFRLDLVSGALTPVSTASGGLQNLGYLAMHPNHHFLYATSETSKGEVAAFALDPKTGALELIDQQISQGGGPCFVALDHGGKNALVANYGGGTVSVLRIRPDGRLSPVSSMIKHERPSGVNADGRQAAPHAHSIRTDPEDRFAVAADLGCDKLFVYRYDPVHGAIAPGSPAAAATHPGAGPRHVAFHLTEPLLFVINELDSTMTSYHYDKARGTLDEIQTLSTLPAGYSGKNSTAEVRIHPSGKFVYGSNRGHDSIVSYALDVSTGRLRSTGHFPILGKTPRNFGIDPTGNWLIAACQDSDRLTVFRIDTITGTLTTDGTGADVPSPVCITFGAV